MDSSVRCVATTLAAGSDMPVTPGQSRSYGRVR
jgi:hypothetical protein